MHHAEEDSRRLVGKEEAMSNKAERWLAQQEIALLEEIYALESPPDCGDTRAVIRVKAHKVRISKPATNATPSNGAITG